MPISFPNRASGLARTHQYSEHIEYTPKIKKIKTLHSRRRRKKNGARFKYGTLNGTLRRQNADRI